MVFSNKLVQGYERKQIGDWSLTSVVIMYSSTKLRKSNYAKGVVCLEMTILSFIHPHVIPNLHYFPFFNRT